MHLRRALTIRHFPIEIDMFENNSGTAPTKLIIMHLRRALTIRHFPIEIDMFENNSGAAPT